MPWITAGATLLGGIIGRSGSGGQQQQQQMPSVNYSQFTPTGEAMPMYGWMAGLGQNVMGSPIPYFPGQTYVGPSELTQAGVDASGAAGDMLSQAGQMAYGGLPNVMQGGQMLANNVGQANMAAGLFNQGLPYYGQAAGYLGQANPYYQNAASLTGGGINDYLAAQSKMQMAGGMAEQGANWLAGKAQGGYFDPYIQTAQNNYNFLSNAADVANNPYVQSMIQQNQLAAQDTLSGQLNQLQGQSVGVGNLGSSRLGLGQGQAVGDVNKAMQATNANMQLNAYQQGLGAQQNALSQTQNLFNTMSMPGTAMGQAAGMMQGAGGMFGQAGGMAGQAGGASAQQGNYYGQMAQNALGQGGAYGQAGNQALQGFNALNQGAQNMINSGLTFGQLAPGLLGSGAQSMLGAAGAYGQGGQTVEGYQQAALQDQMNRFNWLYQEPYQRMGALQGWTQALAPIGVQQGGGIGIQSQQNPNYQSPMQGILGGASLGASFGKALGGLDWFK